MLELEREQSEANAASAAAAATVDSSGNPHSILRRVMAKAQCAMQQPGSWLRRSCRPSRAVLYWNDRKNEKCFSNKSVEMQVLLKWALPHEDDELRDAETRCSSGNNNTKIV
jgi:hypothetical protein